MHEIPHAGSNASGFDLAARTRIIFGPGSVDRIGDLALELGGRRVLLVTDPGIVAAGHAARVATSLAAAGLAVRLYDSVRENPTTADVARCVAEARAHGTDLLVGLGGGSSIDTAKGANFILTNGGEMCDYWGVGKAAHPMLPLVAIPTTAGTGSECQSAALIADEVTHQKMACLDPKAAARVAVLDPILTMSQPRAVTACTGVDALTHAVESAVTLKRNALSSMFSREAFRLVATSLARVLERPDDLEGRGSMLVGAAFAGCAIEHSMLGAAHSCANPLTARFGIVHGVAVGLMLPHVIRFNAADPAARLCYLELAQALGASPNDDDGGLASLLARVEALLNAADIPRSLAEAGVPADSIPDLAAEAAGQWTARFNPRRVGEADFRDLFSSAFTQRNRD